MLHRAIHRWAGRPASVVTLIRSPRFYRVGGEFLWVGTGQLLAAIGAVVGIRVLTSVLSAESYGELALAMTMATLAQQAVLSPLAASTLRFFALAREQGTLPTYFGAALSSMRRVSSGLLAMAAVITGVFWLSGYREFAILAAAAIMFAVLSGCGSILDGVQNAARQRVVVAVHQALSQWLRFGLAAAAVIFLYRSSAAAMSGYALAAGVVLISQWCFLRACFRDELRGRVGLGEENAWRGELHAYGWPFAAWGLFTWVHLASDRWALQLAGTTQEVGFYAVVYQIGYYPITLLSTMIVQLASPVLFQRAGDAGDAGRLRQVRRATWSILAALLFATAGAAALTALFHREVFRLLVSEEFRTVSWLLPWTVCSAGLFASAQIAVLELLSARHTQALLRPKIVTAIVGTLLNIAAAYAFGIQGVVMAGVASSALYLVWALAQARFVRNRDVGRA